MSNIARIMQQAAAGAAAGELLAIEDVFSTYLYTGNGSGQVIQNGINLGQSFGSGSAEFSNYLDTYPVAINSYLTFTGDFTAEAFILIRDRHSVNVCWLGSDYGDGVNTNNQLIINSSGYLAAYNEGPSTLSTASSQQMSLGTWYHVAISRSSGTIYFWVNGVSAGSASHGGTFKFKAIGALGGYSGAAVDGFMSNIRISNNARYTSGFTPPSGALSVDANTVLLALQTDNLFTDKVGTYTLTKSSAVSSSNFGPFNADTAGEGGLVWVKKRNGVDSHVFVDTDRGVGKIISSDTTAAEFTAAASITSFNSDGFSLGNYGWVNGGGGPTYASWTFRKAPRFFDVVTYTGTGSTQSIAHNLGVVPGCIIVKRLDSSSFNWQIYHRSSNATPEDYRLEFTTDPAQLNTNVWGSTPPTNTHFTVGANGDSNGSGGSLVAYLFAHDPLGPSGDGSDGLIACGSYTGNGGSGVNTVTLGFEPQMVILKASSATSGWGMFDNMRGWSNSDDALLSAQSSNAESSVTLGTPTATGFQFDNASTLWNNSGVTYIYIAIRRGPMREPTSGTEVFAVANRVGASGNLGAYRSGFPVDMAFHKVVTSAINPYEIGSRLTQGKSMNTNDTSAEVTQSDQQYGYMNGWNNEASALSTKYSWMFRRAPGFFDVVCWNGTGGSPNISHNLGAVPQLLIQKIRGTTGGWYTQAYVTGINSYGQLQSTSSFTSLGGLNIPTSTTFVPLDNTSGFGFIAYLFATLPGISKVGSYTGTGASDQVIDCGFTTGARFVMLKRTDSTSNWRVWDTARGIVVGNDPSLDLNNTSAENTGFDQIDPDASGFKLKANDFWNTSGAQFIFLAIA